MRNIKTLSSKKVSKTAYFVDTIYMDTNADSFWRRVNTLIKTQKTKQVAIAEQCGINYQTLRGWVTNHRFPSGDEAYRIAAALGTTVEYLVTGKAHGKPDTAKALKHLEAVQDFLKRL